MRSWNSAKNRRVLKEKESKEKFRRETATNQCSSGVVLTTAAVRCNNLRTMVNWIFSDSVTQKRSPSAAFPGSDSASINNIALETPAEKSVSADQSPFSRTQLDHLLRVDLPILGSH